MKKINGILVISLLCLTLGNGILFSQTAEELLPKALQLEEVKGDLEEAINLYNKIVNDFPDNKSAAAKAQLHLGYCYEKLGLEKAKMAFENVLKNYPDQHEYVKAALEKLDAYGNSTAVADPNEGNFVIRKVWEDPPETYGGGISPNGRYLTFINWDSAEMALHDLETGKTRDLTNTGTWMEEGYQFPDASVWSPDSRKIVSFWIIGKKEKTRTELRITDIADGKTEVFLKNDFLGTPYPFVWSRDGNTIWAASMIADKNKNGSELDQATMEKFIVTISLPEGTVSKVLALGQGSKSSGRTDISKDGKYFIFDQSQDSDRDIFDIHILSKDGTQNTIIAPHPAHDWAPQWSSDDKKILFLSDRTGSNALWGVNIENGRQIGEPFIVKESLPRQVHALGITDAGSYYFGVSNQLSDLYTAEMDIESGRLLSQPEKLEVGLETFKFKTLWTPDGQSLIYLSFGADFSRPQVHTPNIIIHDIKTHKEKSFSPDNFFPHHNSQFSYPSITKDGNFFVGVKGTGDRSDFIKINLQNGHMDILKEKLTDNLKDGLVGHFPSLSENGQLLYYLSGDKKAIVSYDFKSKKERDIFRNDKPINAISISPNQKTAAVSFFENGRNQLWLISMDDGKLNLLGTLDRGGADQKESFRMPPVWSPDGKFVLCKSYPSGDLWKIKANGEGGFVKCELNLKNRDYFQVHPDGKKVVFAELKGKYVEVWMMENYLK